MPRQRAFRTLPLGRGAGRRSRSLAGRSHNSGATIHAGRTRVALDETKSNRRRTFQRTSHWAALFFNRTVHLLAPRARFASKSRPAGEKYRSAAFSRSEPCERSGIFLRRSQRGNSERVGEDRRPPRRRANFVILVQRERSKPWRYRTQIERRECGRGQCAAKWESNSNQRAANQCAGWSPSMVRNL